MFRIAFLGLAMLASLNQATAQLILRGPEKAKSGTMQSVLIEKTNKDGEIKVEGFLNGRPTKENYQILKNLDDQLLILVLPQPDDKGSVYTFVAATAGLTTENKPKVYTATHTLEIEGEKPKPPQPNPNPQPNPEATWRDKLSAAYNAAPDKDSLNTYIQLWEALSKQNFRNMGEFENALREGVKQFKIEGKIQGTKNQVTTYLLENLKTDPRITDMKKAEPVIKEVIAALKTL